LQATCRHYSRLVPDAVDPVYANNADILPTGVGPPNAPIAADGIFRQIIERHGEIPELEYQLQKVTWSPAVLETIGNLTIPRAIGYSAGLLDFFFRGELKLSSPPDGLYAVVDQGHLHQVIDGIP